MAERRQERSARMAFAMRPSHQNGAKTQEALLL